MQQFVELFFHPKLTNSRRAQKIECPEELTSGEPLRISATLQSSIDYYWGRLGVGIYDAETMQELFMHLGEENVTVEVETPYIFSTEVQIPRTPGRYRIMLCDDFFAPYAEAGIVEVKKSSDAKNIHDESLRITKRNGIVEISGATPGEEITVYGIEGIIRLRDKADAHGRITLRESANHDIIIVDGRIIRP